MRTATSIWATSAALALALSPIAGATGSPGVATYTVINTNDSGPGSLRQAILDAEFLTRNVHDVINFNIPAGGVQTITLVTPLPSLTDPLGVTIDGFTQMDWVTGAVADPGPNPPATALLLIELDGSGLTTGDGLSLESDDNVIQGLVINAFPGDGIRIVGGRSNAMASDNTVYANFVGTDPTGTQGLGNNRIAPPLSAAGIHVHNDAGGTSLTNVIQGNLVSANLQEGIWIAGPILPGDVAFHDVLNNYVGTDITGVFDLGNVQVGVLLTEGTHDNEILDNLISGNDWDGVSISGFFALSHQVQTHHNTVADNIIGADINLQVLSNSRHGVAIGIYGPIAPSGTADNNLIRRNVIAYNGFDGVSLGGPGFVQENTITQNAIWDNGGLGIDLANDGVTFNDYPEDPDGGPNRRLNFPVINRAATTYSMGWTTIHGTLDIDGATETLVTIELFYADPDFTGHGEGQWYLGSAAPYNNSPPNSGDWTFTTNKLSKGHIVTATATDQFGNTSEFSFNEQINGTPTLLTSAPFLPARLGGVNYLQLDAGPVYKNLGYVILGSLSGVGPTQYYGLTLPLTVDNFTSLTLLAPPPMFVNFAGFLDGNGQAQAELHSSPLPAAAIGNVMHFAYTVHPYNSYVSDPAAIEIVGW